MSSGQRQAAFFDLDKTIIAKSSALVFGKKFFAGGLLTRRAILRSAYAQLVYSGMDEEQVEKIRAHLTEMVAGWDIEQVRSIVAETLHEVVDPIVYDEALELISEHHSAGRDVIVVSASGSEVVQPIGDKLGADHVIATRLAVADGRYTGEIEFYSYGENKAAAIRELAAHRGYDLAQCYAYSDSGTDLPMLEAVGHPTAVNPNKELRTVALERGWPIKQFTVGISLQERLGRFPVPATPVIASTAAVGTAAVVAAVAWFALQARRKAAHAERS